MYYSLRYFFVFFLCLVPYAWAGAASVAVPGDYDSIQQAIDALQENPQLGDTVLVARGTYEENIALASGLTVKGVETMAVFLQAKVSTVPAVSGDAVTDAVLRNFTINSGDTGVKLTASSGVRVINNVFRMGSDATAIETDDQTDAEIFHNTFYDNGTAVSRGSALTILNYNIFSNNDVAISPNSLTNGINANCLANNSTDGPNGLDVVTTNDAQFAGGSFNDFHLKQGSPCINAAVGTDVIDNTTADMGAYGGANADIYPAQVRSLLVTDVSDEIGSTSVRLSWAANASHRVSHDTNPGGYKIYYDSDASGEPYSGTDALAGTQASPIDVGNETSFDLTDLSPASLQLSVPVITGTSPATGVVGLHWTAVNGATSYRIYYGLNDVSENVLEVDDVSYHVISGLTDGVSYQFSVSAVFQPHYYFVVTTYDNSADTNESRLSAEANIVLGDTAESDLSGIVTAIPEAAVPYPILPNEGCFIATAAFGYYDAPQVQLLRDFRDQILLSNSIGQSLVKWYYANSPEAAKYINQHEQWKPLIQAALLPLIAMAWLTTQLGWPLQLLLCVLLAAVTWLRWQRRGVSQSISGEAVS